MAKVFDFIHATNDVLTERGVELPLRGQSTTTPEDRMEKGLAVQKKIVGAEAVEAMYAAARDDEMHIQRYLSGNCFGITSPALASTCVRANCSRCRCWSRSAAASLK
jgi:4-carboxymuconolactone decarboxylase